MTVPSRRRYTAEFNAQILELADHGSAVSELAQEFEVNAGLIYTWRRKASQQAQLGCGDAGVPPRRDDQDVANESGVATIETPFAVAIEDCAGLRRQGLIEVGVMLLESAFEAVAEALLLREDERAVGGGRCGGHC